MKKYLIVGGIFFITIIITIYVIVKPDSRDVTIVTPTPTPTLLPSLYNGINLEIASGSAVISRLGSPLRSDAFQGVITYIYPTAEKGRNTSVELYENGRVRRIIEPVINRQLFSSVASGLGAADMELYGKHEKLGFRLYVYLPRGIALLANPSTQEVRERWYFPVTSASAFLEGLGIGFSTQRVEEKQ